MATVVRRRPARRGRSPADRIFIPPGGMLMRSSVSVTVRKRRGRFNRPMMPPSIEKLPTVTSGGTSRRFLWRITSPWPRTVTVGKMSTLNAPSSTSLSSRSASPSMTRRRSVSVRDPAAAAMVSATRVPPRAIRIHRALLSVTTASLRIHAPTSSRPPEEMLEHVAGDFLTILRSRADVVNWRKV